MTPGTRTQFFRFIVCLPILFSPLLTCGQVSSEPSIIDQILSFSDRLVTIRTNENGLYGSGQSDFLEPKSGRIFRVKDMRLARVSLQGTGVLLDSSGIIVTNAHNVRERGRIEVTTQDGEVKEAQLLALIPKSDLAFIRIQVSKPIKDVEFADSESARLRDNVYTVGGSGVLKNTISQGRITGIGQNADVFQVGFNIYHGDSGSPLLDKDGKLLGLMTASRLHANRMAYAVRSSLIKKNYETLRQRA